MIESYRISKQREEEAERLKQETVESLNTSKTYFEQQGLDILHNFKEDVDKMLGEQLESLNQKQAEMDRRRKRTYRQAGGIKWLLTICYIKIFPML